MWDRHGRHRMVVGFTATCTISAYHHKVVNSNPAHVEVNSIQFYVIKFVSDLRQVSNYLRVLRFPPQITLTATITEILFKVSLNIITHNPIQEV